MKRREQELGLGIAAALLAALVSALSAAPSAFAGTVYVPLAMDKDVDGVHITTEVRVTNDSERPRELSYLFLPEQLDGTLPDRETESVVMTLESHQTLILTDFVSSGERGILEIEAHARISITSRLVGTGPDGTVRAGVEMPVVTSDNLVAGGKSALLQGLGRDAPLVTDFYLLNLGTSETTCDAAFYLRSGGLLGGGTVTLPALTLFSYEDILAQLGQPRRNEVSASITCDRRFHSFAVLTDQLTGELVYIPPSGSGRSALAPPSPEPEEPTGPLPPAVACPEGALFEKLGAFHRPAPGAETRRFEIPMQDGQRYSRLTIDVDFTPGDWNQPSDGNHAVVWLNRTERWGGNVLAYVNVFGPDRSIAKISTNADLADGAQMHAFTEKAVFEKGVRYHLRYVFDTSQNLMEAVFTSATGTPDEVEVVRVTGTTTTNVIRSKEPGLFVYFGHPTGTVGPELPTYDWLYANLCVQLE